MSAEIDSEALASTRIEAAMMSLIESCNRLVMSQRLAPWEAKLALMRCLLAAVCTYAKPGREQEVIEVIAYTLRRELPMMIDLVKRGRLRDAPPGGIA